MKASIHKLMKINIYSNRKESKILINKISENNKAYPGLLYNIYDRPKILYVLGNIENLKGNCISIVGSRNPTNIGKIITEKISYKLAINGNIIVSGLANGIDTYAHIGALKAHGKTIAVLPKSLDKIYPLNNRKLAIEILKNEGTIISEYDFFDEVNKNNFSYRNRIISGLSMSTIIVEARKNSGTLVTANFALDQGRNVCVVPGNITELNYEGSNDLIKEGAEIFNLNML